MMRMVILDRVRSWGCSGDKRGRTRGRAGYAPRGGLLWPRSAAPRPRLVREPVHRRASAGLPPHGGHRERDHGTITCEECQSLVRSDLSVVPTVVNLCVRCDAGQLQQAAARASRDQCRRVHT